MATHMARRILHLLFILIALMAPLSDLLAQADTTDNPIQISTTPDTTSGFGAGFLSDTTAQSDTTATTSDSLATRMVDTAAINSSPLFQAPVRSSATQSAYPMPTATSGRTTRLGFYGAADYSMQKGELFFAGPSGTPSGGICICSFTEGNGLGYAAGLSLLLGFNNDRWWQTTRVSFDSRSAQSSFSETTIIERPGFEPDTQVTTETFDLNFQMINGEVLFSRSLGFAGIYATGGIALGYMVANSYGVTISIDEVEYKPREGTLEPVEKLTTSVIGGLGMRVKFAGSRVMLQPEILYTYPLEEISRKYRWGYKSIRAGISMLVDL